MLRGERVRLAPIREVDLAAFYDAHVDIANRGDFFPLGVMSEPAMRPASPSTGSGSATRARS